MIFFQKFGFDRCISWDSRIPPSKLIHNDSLHVRFGGIGNTKTWSKSRFLQTVTAKKKRKKKREVWFMVRLYCTLILNTRMYNCLEFEPVQGKC